MLLAIYGPPSRVKRKQFWEFMENMVASYKGTWVITSDLNCIKGKGEKKGGAPIIVGSINCLRDYFVEHRGHRFGLQRSIIYLVEQREGRTNIRKRLDRCLCDQSWQINHPKVGVKHLCLARSDHNPILLDTHMEES